MPQTLPNGLKTPINSDAYNLTADLATMGNSANVVIAVANKAARDALTAVAGMTVSRLDLPGAPLQTYDGTDWGTSDVAWSSLSTVAGFSALTSSGWSGVSYRVKDGHVTVTGAVSRAAAWAADQVFTVMPAGLKPAVKIQGVNCQVETTVGNVVFDSAGSSARSFFASWPVD